jgi:ABC-2 type transport system ATP-binding protein
MQQRLGLARVLIHDPKLLLLDEPASGLDPRARIEMMAILQELQRMGKTIIISSHILSELQTLCNRVAIIEKGKLIYAGPVQGARQQIGDTAVFWVRPDPDDHATAIALLKSDPRTESSTRRTRRGPHQDHPRQPRHRPVLHPGNPRPKPRTASSSSTRTKSGLEKVFLHVTKGETKPQ